MNRKYKTTSLACYVGYGTQAMVLNFPPLLFITFHEAWGISDAMLALLISASFLIQLGLGFVAAYVLDKLNERFCLLLSQALAMIGMICLSILPFTMSNAYIGIVISLLIASFGSGLTEVLISPLIERCPSDHKEAQMGLLHSFYSWGFLAVVLLSTLFFTLIGIENWRILSALFALIPFTSFLLFLFVPLPPALPKEKRMGVGKLTRSPIFWMLLCAMVCAGAAEQAMSQWASAFAEAGLGVSKTVGDLAGPCAFAAFMGTARVLYGKLEHKIPLTNVMIVCGFMNICAYLLASLSPHPVMGLIGLGLCGFSVGIMWPGTLSVGASALPYGGTAMFAFLALSGDLGCTLGPSLIGLVSDATGGKMELGLLLAIVFPVMLTVNLILIRRIGCKKKDT